MLILMYICLFAEIILLPFMIKAGFPDLTKKSFILKIFCSLLFIVFAVAAVMRGDKDMDSYREMIIAGLACGFVGDVLLGIEPILGEKKKLLLPSIIVGAVAFLAGHILYTVAFAKQIKLRSIGLGAIFFISLVLVLVAVVVLKFILKIKTGKLTVPVLIYAIMIDIMFCLALTFGIGTHSILVGGLLGIGALCFMASDLNLALKYFDSDRFCTLSNRCLYVDLYYAAQFMIATTLLFL